MHVKAFTKVCLRILGRQNMSKQGLPIYLTISNANSKPLFLVFLKVCRDLKKFNFLLTEVLSTLMAYPLMPNVVTIGFCTSTLKDESPPEDENPSFGLPEELSCEEKLG